MFVYIWEYKVKPDKISAFVENYNAAGNWVKLFKRSKGFIRTELYQDVSDKYRFVTTDYWNSKAERDAFRKDFKSEFAILDEQCESFTESEKFIGDFNTVQ